MKRKVIQIADSTQLVSLPRKWAKKHNVKKGDELEIEEDVDRLIVSFPNTTKSIKKVEINVPEDLGGTTRALVGAAYKSGYDELRINSVNQEGLKYAQFIINTFCIGFEIIEQGKQYIIARKISDAIYGEFDTILRRQLLFLSRVLDESFEAAQTLDEEHLNAVITMDTSINKFSYFCKRVLNSKGVGSHRDTSMTYFIVDELEEIGDCYKAINTQLLKRKLKLGKDFMAYYEAVNEFVKKFLNLFYKFSLDEFRNFRVMKKELDKQLDVVFEKVSKNELRSLFWLNMIKERIYNLDGPLLLLKYEKVTVIKED